jgi:hypothetical protein
LSLDINQKQNSTKPRHFSSFSNEYTSLRTPNLSFFSYEKAGRFLLVNTCLAIAKKVIQKNTNITVDQDLIDTQILGF